MKLRDANGKFHALGGLVNKEVHDEDSSPRPVPHLHRLDREHQRLASWDDIRKRLQIRTFGGAGATVPPVPRVVRIRGLKGKVAIFRWTWDGKGVFFVTPRGVFAADLSTLPGDVEPGAVSELTVVPVEVPGSMRNVRPVPGGLMALGSKAWLIRDQHPPQLLAKTDAQSGSVARNGDMLIATDGEIHRLAVRDGEVQVVHRRKCAGWPDCAVVNWAATGDRLAYALTDGNVVLSAGDTDVLFPLPSVVRTLWFSPDGSVLLAVTADQAVLIDATTRKRRSTWTRTTPGEIHSAHFAPGGDQVLLAAGRDVRRIDTATGKARWWFKTRAKRLEIDEGYGALSEVFLDDLVALPNGALAYSLVRTRQQENDDEEEYID